MDELEDFGLTADDLAQAGLTLDDLHEHQNDEASLKNAIEVSSGDDLEQSNFSHILVNSDDLKNPALLQELKELGSSSEEELSGNHGSVSLEGDELEEKVSPPEFNNSTLTDGLEHEQLGAVDYVVSRTVTPDSTSHVLVDEESEKDVAIDVLASTSASASAPAVIVPEPRQREIDSLKAKAVALHRVGKKDEAISALRRMKQLQALQEHGLSSTKLLKRGSEVFHKALDVQDQRHSDIREILPIIQSRLLEYTNVAVEHKNNGQLERAKALLPAIRKLKSEKQKAEQGLVSLSALETLPPPLSELEHNEQSADKDESSPTLPAESRRKLEFDTLEERLEKQIDRIMSEIKVALRLGKKDLARDFLRVKSRTQHDLETVHSSRQKGLPVPSTCTRSRKVVKLHEHLHVGSNQLELEIFKAEGLAPPSGWKLCSSYVYYELAYPKDSIQKGKSNTIIKSDDPEYQFKTMLSFPRPKRAGRMFKFIKVTLSVFAPRTLLKDISLGTITIKLGDFLEKSDIAGKFPLRGGRGSLHLALRLRNPLAGFDIRTETVEDLYLVQPDNVSTAVPVSISAPVSQEISQPSRYPDDSLTLAQTSLSSDVQAPESTLAAAATQVVDSTSIGVPSRISPTDWEDPLRVEAMCSNDVLSAEIGDAQQRIALLRAKKQNIPPAVLARYNAMNLALNNLVEQVMQGQLSLGDYLSLLRKDIARLSTLSIALQNRGRSQEAAKLKQWLKIEKEEVKNAEDNM